MYRSRVNINDAAAQNVRIVLTATNGVFDSLPGICKTSGVTPVSAISTDGKILTCNTGDWQQGSSFRIDIIVRANGPNNSQVNLIATQTSDGRSDIVRNGDPKTITADFRSDFGIYGGNTYNYYTSGANTPYSIENVGYAIPIYWRVALKPIQRE